MTSLGPALHSGRKKLSGQTSSASRRSWAEARITPSPHPHSTPTPAAPNSQSGSWRPDNTAGQSPTQRIRIPDSRHGARHAPVPLSSRPPPRLPRGAHPLHPRHRSARQPGTRVFVRPRGSAPRGGRRPLTHSNAARRLPTRPQSLPVGTSAAPCRSRFPAASPCLGRCQIRPGNVAGDRPAPAGQWQVSYVRPAGGRPRTRGPRVLASPRLGEDVYPGCRGAEGRLGELPELCLLLGQVHARTGRADGPTPCGAPDTGVLVLVCRTGPRVFRQRIRLPSLGSHVAIT